MYSVTHLRNIAACVFLSVRCSTSAQSLWYQTIGQCSQDVMTGLTNFESAFVNACVIAIK